MFYTFIQNNSGGFWIGPHFVCVECDSLEEANQIAQSHGVYFDGVKNGKDCGCCGSRWERARWVDYLTEEPTYYGSPLKEEKDYKIVYKDGRIVNG